MHTIKACVCVMCKHTQSMHPDGLKVKHTREYVDDLM